MTRPVLITGGAGFVAAHLARRFHQAGTPVWLADIREPAGAMASLLPPHVHFSRCDVRDPDQVRAAVNASGAAGIVHTAAVVGPAAAGAEPTRATAVNVMGTQHILEVARVCGMRVTYLSTATLYGRRPDLRPLHEDDPPDPVSLYDATKLMGEMLSLAYARTFGLDVAIVRTGFVYGPGSGIGEYFLPRVLRGAAVSEPVGADHPCDFTYVTDLASGLYLAHTTRPLTHRLFNVTGGILRTRAELAEAVRAAVPGAAISLGPGTDPARHLRGPCDLSRARAGLGYVPRVSLEAGIALWADSLQSLLT